MKLLLFDYHGVTLEAGPLRRQFEQLLALYAGVPADDWLHGFRTRAGRKAPGQSLGGGYDRDGGAVFGQLLSTLARAGAATDDAALRERVALLVHEWGQCFGAEGPNIVAPADTLAHALSQLIGGLVDAFLYAAVDDVPPLLNRLVTWSMRTLVPARLQAAPGAAVPGSAPSASMTLSAPQCPTLGENLYRAFLATGDQKYRELAALWEEPLIRRRHERTRALHHVGALCSAAAGYFVRRDTRTLESLAEAWPLLQAQMFATGAFGPDDVLLAPEQLPAALLQSKSHFHVPCGAALGLRLANYMLRFTGEAAFGDWAERLLYNALLASPPPAPDGRLWRHASYALDGATKELDPQPWPCCAGSLPLAVTDCHDMIYFRPGAEGDGGLYINLYAPSTVDWQCGETFVSLAQHTRFPEENTVEISLFAARPVRFALRLRAPAWLAGPMRIDVSGESITAAPDDQRWVTIDRKWTSADTIAIKLPMRLAAMPLVPPDLDLTPGAADAFSANAASTPRAEAAVAPGANAASVPGRAASAGASFAAAAQARAITYGPVVLAVRTTAAPPHGRIHLADLEHELVPSPAEPLSWHVRRAPDLLVRSFYAFRQHERYFMYIKPSG